MLWKTASIVNLKTAESKTIFVPPAGTAWSKDLWAPEVLFVGDKWYAYFAADGGNNQGHRCPTPLPQRKVNDNQGRHADFNRCVSDGVFMAGKE